MEAILDLAHRGARLQHQPPGVSNEVDRGTVSLNGPRFGFQPTGPLADSDIGARPPLSDPVGMNANGGPHITDPTPPNQRDRRAHRARQLSALALAARHGHQDLAWRARHRSSFDPGIKGVREFVRTLPDPHQLERWWRQHDEDDLGSADVGQAGSPLRRRATSPRTSRMIATTGAESIAPRRPATTPPTIVDPRFTIG